MQYNHCVTKINKESDSQQLRVETQEGMAGNFDTVILTMPVPQILQLKGDVQDIISMFNCIIITFISSALGEEKLDVIHKKYISQLL